MDLLFVDNIKKLLLKYNARPSKMLGQNFLIDKSTLDKIIGASQLTSKDFILEIGPGIGTLTQELAKKVKKVIAVEKDGTMIEILKETLKDFNNINVVNNDILKISNPQLPSANYKVVANIPYYLTSPLIRKFLEEKHNPSMMMLMVQKEVAQRICAKPPRLSLLAVSVQFYAKAEIVSFISNGCFWPAPKVDSAIIKITPFENKKNTDTKLFFDIVKAGFSQPRKQLANNLSKSLKKEREIVNQWLLKNNVQPMQRAETLNIQDWINLTKSY